MEEIAVVGDKETILGFKLAGVANTNAVACTREDADEKFFQVMQNPRIGLVILSGDTESFLSAKTRKLIDSSAKPVVLTILGKLSKPSESNQLAAMVKKAIGVDISKK